MKENVFSFKQFKIHHGSSSMKVGVDAVLLGCWAGEKAETILDVGTGCGVIALILAQRFQEAKIDGIDIDQESIEEASLNFNESPWRERLKVEKRKFPNIEKYKKYDLIVSNPPYFSAGLKNPETPREKARHQDTLSIFTLIEECGKYLTECGRLSMIFPSEFYDMAIKRGEEKGMFPSRVCFIRDREASKEKRVMLEMGKERKDFIKEKLVLFGDERKPTENYRALCKDFYLKF